MTDDPYAGFTVMAAYDWPAEVEDVWPPGRLRPSAMAAYDSLVVAGEIRPQEAKRRCDGAVVVRYRAKIPDAWVHDLLRKAEKRFPLILVAL